MDRIDGIERSFCDDAVRADMSAILANSWGASQPRGIESMYSRVFKGMYVLHIHPFNKDCSLLTYILTQKKTAWKPRCVLICTKEFPLQDKRGCWQRQATHNGRLDWSCTTHPSLQESTSGMTYPTDDARVRTMIALSMEWQWKWLTIVSYHQHMTYDSLDTLKRIEERCGSEYICNMLSWVAKEFASLERSVLNDQLSEIETDTWWS